MSAAASGRRVLETGIRRESCRAVNPQLTLALILLASIALNVGLVILYMARRVGPQYWLDVWTGNGWDPVRVKPGQKQMTYKRGDGKKLLFLLDEAWGKPYGKRGMKWLGHALNAGDMLAWSTEKKEWVAVVPDAAGVVPVDPGTVKAVVWRELRPGEQPPEEKGAMLRVEWLTRAISPAADYLQTALDDIREVKWFEGQKKAEITAAPVKPNWLLIAAAAALVYFLFLR